MPLLEVQDLKKYFPVERSLLDRLFSRERRFVRAVDGVSFTLEKGEVLALIGESGCGKTTTGRVVLRLIEPTAGKVFFNGIEVTALSDEEMRRLRRRMQMIFQDPYASLNPKMRIGRMLEHPLLIHGIATKKEAREEALRLLERVGLTPADEFYYRYPHQLSGGQRQRVAIARAMITKPDFVVADEPVSMIDVSMRASILDLLQDFRKEYGLSMLFITHDIAVGRVIADRIAVMYLGKIVEMGPTEEVINNPAHPYTLALIEAVPSIKRRRRKEKRRIIVGGEVPNPINPPSGCRFHPRCPYATQICAQEEPKLGKVGPQHYAACHHPLRQESS